MPCTNHAEIVEDLVKCSRCGKPFCPDCVVQLKGMFYCAGCKTEQVKDIASGADSTEIELASIGRRFGAMFVDGFLLNIVTAIVQAGILGTVNRVGPDPSVMIVAIVVPLCMIFSYIGFMLQLKGQTLGKMAFKVKVVTPEGGDISAGQAWGRAFVQVVLGSVLIDYIPALVTKQKTCIHDLVAKTRVVDWRR